MEAQYQRGKIQEESMYYEMKKHTGELPIIGVNTYLNPNPPSEEEIDNMELARATKEEKETANSQLERISKKNIKIKSKRIRTIKRSCHYWR